MCSVSFKKIVQCQRYDTKTHSYIYIMNCTLFQMMAMRQQQQHQQQQQASMAGTQSSFLQWFMPKRGEATLQDFMEQ